MLTIVTVLWRGDFRGRDYTHEHVRCVRRMGNRWLPHTPFNFICLTNDPDPAADYVQLPLKRPDILVGWWAKLELFMNSVLMDGSSSRLLYLDLDSIICGPLDDLVNTPGRIVFAPPLGVPSTDPRIIKGVVTRLQSSVILWDAGSYRFDLSDGEIAKIKQMFRGDQDYFGAGMNDAVLFPKSWFMKLKNCWEFGPPSETKIIFGHPKPLWNRRMEKDWVRKLLQ